MLDKFGTLVQDAQFPVTILGNPQTGDFELFDITEALPELDEIRTRIATRRLHFIGTVGLVNGAPQSALDEPLDDNNIRALSQVYLAHIGSKLLAEANRTNDPAVRELDALFALKDPRTA